MTEQSYQLLNNFSHSGDNIQTAVSVAKECGILSPQESVIDVTVIMEENRLKPEIYFNAQEMSPKLVILLEIFKIAIQKIKNLFHFFRVFVINNLKYQS